MEYPGERFHVSFVASKGRVAPLKLQSIPRLELQAALLGSRLARFIQEEHNYVITRRIFWTDSQTVLNWIRSDPRSYKMFVTHRLGEIDELTDVQEWRWVLSAQNPADDATKEKSGTKTVGFRWLHGPEFLKTNKNRWPNSSHSEILPKRRRRLKCRMQWFTLRIRRVYQI